MKVFFQTGCNCSISHQNVYAYIYSGAHTMREVRAEQPSVKLSVKLLENPHLPYANPFITYRTLPLYHHLWVYFAAFTLVKILGKALYYTCDIVITLVPTI